MSHFFILALPRSRTAWLSLLLTHGPVRCLHDPLLGCEAVADLAGKFSLTGAPVVGAADTMAPIFVDRLAELFPAARWAVVRRPQEECEASMAEIGLPLSAEAMTVIRQCLDYTIESYDPLVVDFCDLDDEATVRRIWAHCTDGLPFPRPWYQQIKDLRIEVMPEALKRNMVMNEHNTLKLLEEAVWQPSGQQ